MLSETQIQLQNAQHSILFLQKEHAKTIEGLHKEINDLQKKCSGLTVKLMLLTDAKDIENERGILETKNDALIKEVNELKLENAELRSVLDVRDKRILLLEGQLRSKDKKYADESKATAKRLADLQTEADSKANTIAILTGQLHQLKRSVRSSTNLKSSHSDYHNSESYVPIMSPTPPMEGAPSRARQRVYHRYSSSPPPQLTGLVISSGVSSTSLKEATREQTLAQTARSLPARPKLSYANAPRPAHGFSASRHEKEIKYFSKPKPEDYKDFLRGAERIEHGIVAKVPSEPLPPITTEFISNNSHSEKGPSTKSKHKMDANRSSLHETIEPEVGTFALNTMSSPRKYVREGESPNTS